MRFKNTLIVVNDIERSKQFYKYYFGLDVIAEFEGNVMLMGGLVLQDRTIWENVIGKEVMFQTGNTVLYFEENSFDWFLERLKSREDTVEYLTMPQELSTGQRIVRIYDPDGTILEIRESADAAARRKQAQEDPSE